MSDRQLTTEELLSIATEGEQESLTQETRRIKMEYSVMDFIRDSKIKIGTDKVATYVIYYLYKRVWKRWSDKKLTKVHFFKEFSKQFEQKRHGKQRYYLLGEITLDHATICRADEFARNEKENSHVKKEKKQTK